MKRSSKACTRKGVRLNYPRSCVGFLSSGIREEIMNCGVSTEFPRVVGVRVLDRNKRPHRL